MADWSLLPKDLLEHVAKRIFFSIDILRFRSVCTSWRSSVTHPPHHPFPNRVPVDPSISPILNNSNFFYLSKRSIYRLALRNNLPTTSRNQQGWLIKLEQNALNTTSRLLHPISEAPIHPLPPSFPKTLNLIDIQILELGQEYVLRYNDRSPFKHAGDVYREKVVFSPSSPWSSDPNDFVIITIHVSGRLAMFSFKENKWSIIPEMTSPFDDVILFKGKFYAVDSTGRAVVVLPDLGVKEIATSVFGGDQKYLIQSDGDLLLVDRYLSSAGSDEYIGYIDPNYEYEIYVPNDDTYVMDKTVWFKVYMLDWYEHNWIEVKSLGDRVLFLGDNSGFSAAAVDFFGCKGNCIYFTDKCFQPDREDDSAFKGHSIGLFNVEDGTIGPLSSYEGHSHVFWPPPAWVASETS